jgi:hypothetical protein
MGSHKTFTIVKILCKQCNNWVFILIFLLSVNYGKVGNFGIHDNVSRQKYQYYKFT